MGRQSLNFFFFSVCPRLEETKQASLDKMSLPIIKHDMPPSFLPADVIKELSRELDQEAVECEFNPKVYDYDYY